MTDYIRKAVELADGFEIIEEDPENWWVSVNVEHTPGRPHYRMRDAHWRWTWLHDLLAAQLVRQVDALGFEVVVWSDLTRIRSKGDDYLEHMKPQDGDRTMNTIKAIVDSGVLE